MRVQGGEKQPEPARRRAPAGNDCLEVLIHRHGEEHIDTLARLISLTTRVENSLTRTTFTHH